MTLAFDPNQTSVRGIDKHKQKQASRKKQENYGQSKLIIYKQVTGKVVRTKGWSM